MWGNVGIDRAHSPTSRVYYALTAKYNRRGKASGPCGPQKIRARAEAYEWRARACGGVLSRACVGRFSLPRGPRGGARLARRPTHVPAYKIRSFPKTARISKAGSSG